MFIKTLPVGQLETNCYIVGNEDSLKCVVIDPGDESNTILDYIESNRLQCEAILLTHGHFDHTGAVNAILEELDVPVYMNCRDEAKNAGDGYLRFDLPAGGHSYDEGDAPELAGLRFEVLATPGHTPGSVTLKCGDALFTGDTLFKGSCGRTDFPSGSLEDELRSLKKLCALEGDFEVYPGHMDSSTLQREKMFNYYCREAQSKGN